MTAKFEYKFVRIGKGLLGIKGGTQDQYQEIVREHARDGWRLAQVFAPALGSRGDALFFDIIFEKEVGF